MRPAALITDLDGTLLDQNSRCSLRNFKCLEILGERGILRGIATGRSLFSARKALTPDFPIDYLIFSSGAGVMHWPKQELIFSAHLQSAEIQPLLTVLQAEKLDFMVHGPIPDNHHFMYQQNSIENPDFVSRLALYQGYGQPLIDNSLAWSEITEILMITPADEALTRFDWLVKNWPQYQIIRATSPLDMVSGWLEVFPRYISKSQTSHWLLEQHRLDPNQTLAVGNDYNDTDLLAWAGSACVVANAPLELRQNYREVASHCQDGFSEAVEHWLNSNL
jgi:hydroxymethylpyrimidine pyrophosphatase-like HAD family hydrolase